MTRRKLIAGNWKMHNPVPASRELVSDLRRLVSQVRDRDVLVIPPYTVLHAVSQRLEGSNIALGAQELYPEDSGAFTGAIRTVKGVFEEAHEGTLLLDEVTEMPTHLQAKLLRVLQEGEFSRVGSTQIRETDVRIIATSNSDVQQAIAKEKFRQDLFFRLDVISVRIPPLRERKDDIPFLCDHFLKKYSEKYSKNVTEVDKEVIDHFFNYNWPGNVRELENVIQRSVLSCREGSRIQMAHLPSHWPAANQENKLQLNLNEDLSIH